MKDWDKYLLGAAVALLVHGIFVVTPPEKAVANLLAWWIMFVG